MENRSDINLKKDFNPEITFKSGNTINANGCAICALCSTCNCYDEVKISFKHLSYVGMVGLISM